MRMIYPHNICTSSASSAIVVTAINTSHQSLRWITSAALTNARLRGVQRRHRVYLSA
jgi:hypothetical protein